MLCTRVSDHILPMQTQILANISCGSHHVPMPALKGGCRTRALGPTPPCADTHVTHVPLLVLKGGLELQHQRVHAVHDLLAQACVVGSGRGRRGCFMRSLSGPAGTTDLLVQVCTGIKGRWKGGLYHEKMVIRSSTSVRPASELPMSMVRVYSNLPVCTQY